MKTGSKFVTPISPITRNILERNNYKMEITSNQKYNQFLKGIGVALGCLFPLNHAYCPAYLRMYGGFRSRRFQGVLQIMM